MNLEPAVGGASDSRSASNAQLFGAGASSKEISQDLPAKL